MRNKNLIIGVVVGGFVILGLVFLLMNAQTTKLSCEMKSEESGVKSTSTFDITFKSDKMKSIKTKNSLVVTTDEYKDNIELVYNSLQDQFENAKQDKGVIVNLNKTSDSVSLEVVINAKSSPDQVSLVGSGITSKMDYNTVKSTLEKEGYTCR